MLREWTVAAIATINKTTMGDLYLAYGAAPEGVQLLSWYYFFAGVDAAETRRVPPPMRTVTPGERLWRFYAERAGLAKECTWGNMHSCGRTQYEDAATSLGITPVEEPMA